MKKVSNNTFYILLFSSIFLLLPTCWSHNNENSNLDKIPIEVKVLYLEDYPGTIYLYDTKTNKQVKLLDNLFDKLCGNLDISRDGSKIIFGSSKDGTWDIYLADLDLINNRVSNPEAILDTSSWEEDPRFSYNGDKFVCKKDGDICVYDIDLNQTEVDKNQIIKSEKNITYFTDKEEWAPAFSPDDRYIVFGRGTDKTNPLGDIVLYDTENKTTELITSSSNHEWFPSFNYNGDLIYVFQASEDCNDDIYMIEKEDLNNGYYNNYFPVPKLNECTMESTEGIRERISDADPLIVYGDNNYLGFVSDRNSDKYGIYLYSFIVQKVYSVLLNPEIKLLGPVIYVKNDSERPTKPSNLIATPTSSGRIDLSWKESRDNVCVVAYKIYRDGSYLKSTSSTSTYDTDLSYSTEYCYTVSAYDASNNESKKSNQSCATTFDLSEKYQWYAYGDHHYTLTLEYGTWSESEAEAISVGGHLVTIMSAPV